MVTYRVLSLSKDGALVVITPGFSIQMKIRTVTVRGKIRFDLESDLPIKFWVRGQSVEIREAGEMKDGETRIQIQVKSKELLLFGHSEAGAASVRIEIAGVFKNGWVLLRVSAGFSKGDIEDAAILLDEEVIRFRQEEEGMLCASLSDLLRRIIEKRIEAANDRRVRMMEQVGRRLPRSRINRMMR